MTDEQLSAILSALQSVQLAIQNAVADVLAGPVQVGEVALQAEQIADLSERLYVVQGLQVIVICFVALVAGVGLGNILARWFK